MKINPSPVDSTDLNRLFATFSFEEQLDELFGKLTSRYDIISGRVFILESVDTEELVCTYSVDMNNLNDDALLSNTILVHRKKDFNVLYSINALNILIASMNDGKIDPNYKINWSDYKNSLLITREGKFSKLSTKVKDIIYL